MEMCCMRCAKEGRGGREVALVGGSEIEGMEEMVNMERGKNDYGSTDDNSTSGYWQ